MVFSADVVFVSGWGSGVGLDCERGRAVGGLLLALASVLEWSGLPVAWMPSRPFWVLPNVNCLSLGSCARKGGRAWTIGPLGLGGRGTWVHGSSVGK